jgi:uncharacterized protein YydD (DUF2326 family)
MLTQIYSETNLLNPVVFNPGINIILGKYSTNEEKNGINGIGKSSLVRLIDFLLLSNSAERTFGQPNYDFLREENHNVVLEFKQGGTNYFIRRTFKLGDAIFFGLSPNDLDEYTKQELKKVLANKFFPFQDDEVFFVGERYGTLMDFFIKDDLESQQRVDPLDFSAGIKSQIEKAIFNFFLYALPTKELFKFKEFVTNHEKSSNTVNGLEDNIKADNGGKSIEEFRSEKIKIEKKFLYLRKVLTTIHFLKTTKI